MSASIQRKALRPEIGDRVTCIVSKEAYYSDYNGSPVVTFAPGMVGIVADFAAKVRIVSGPGMDREDTFVVVDFDCPVTRKQQRVSLNFCNVKIMPSCQSVLKGRSYELPN
ncbi:hypothetical protein LCGC14_1326860 [marine sediment metagenome]|uniref:Uncharacterized protein n=1 Tax=marine sediment metagenome TaxID=412755 RepID=A0A0F9KIC7_9ZZZZ